ncbi:MAG: ATP-dependent Clp protease proteolytic subunit [Verrucomicrobiota bacterium]
MRELDDYVKEALAKRLADLEAHFCSDCIFYYGPIFPSIEKRFREFIELLKNNGKPNSRLVVFLNSPGGSAETVEKLVEMIRHHYKEVFFVVPDEAMSAGTIFCMAGDRIYMDYSSSLGPIDPQVFNGKDWVPALGYLDQVEKLIEKSSKNELTEAELIILQNQDLALLSQFEQAKNLTITLLKRWLVEYKFKDWKKHQSNPEKSGEKVTRVEKEERASEIAKQLSDNKLWHSHGRKISATTLSKVIRLKIEDYSKDDDLRIKIRAYNDFLIDYITRHDAKFFLHSRCYF